MQVETWLAKYIDCEPSEIDLELIAGDASPRRFFRLHCTTNLPSGAPASVVLMKSPPTENNERFVLVQGLLESGSVRVPRLIRADLGEGWFLLEDLGDKTFHQALASDPSDQLYEHALEALVTIASVPVEAVLPTYDAGRLQGELDVFPEWFLGKALELTLDDDARRIVAGLSELLVASALEQPAIMVHRDYHSRNLMVLPNSGELAVIDFQDAVFGPLTYDAVSLLRDCYVVWPREQQLKWLSDYRDKLLQRDVVDALDFDRLVVWFDFMGLQRHIKVLGVFSRLWLRDEKPAYLADLPVVVDYVLDACDRYSDSYEVVDTFKRWFRADVLPVLNQQSWWQERSL